jgi:glutaconate CoA-transferase subunit A
MSEIFSNERRLLFMNISPDKVMGLREAIESYVPNGCHICIGGFTLNRNPMAAVYEIMRQGIRDLHLYAHSNGQGVDELVGGGCVSMLEIAYGGTGRFAPTCIRFRKAVQEGVVSVEDYSNYQMTLRFLAGAMGIPFMPTRSSLGTDIVQKWGFSKNVRKNAPRIPDKKLVVMENPFDSWAGAPRVILVPAINPDVALIHVQKADRQGTCRIKGLTFADVEQAKSAKHLIITCEELLEPDALRADPDQNQIPFFHTDAVVHVPMGAYPTACYQYYDYDPAYLGEYGRIAQDEERYRAYLERFVYGIKDHGELLLMVGEERIQAIKADPRTGYARNLDRR